MAYAEKQKLAVDVRQLKQEVRSLRSLLISIAGIDAEGAYRSDFVRSVRRAAAESPRHVFSAPDAFLSQLKEI